jgi:hypothetical protein
LNEAIEIYNQIPEDIIYVIPQNPLKPSIQDCLNCEDTPNSPKYNRKTLAMKISALKKLVEKPSIDQARQYLQLGSAYYSISHFGGSWIATDYFRSGSDLWYFYQQKTPNPNLVFAFNANVGKAKYYFERAMNVAENQGEKELAAEACFMAAKCEQAEYYLKPIHKESWGDIQPSYAASDRQYFLKLEKSFKKTKYYKQALNECAYFNVFVRLQKK